MVRGVAESEGFGKGGGIYVCQGEGCAEVGELDAGCAANAAPCAGNNNDLVGERPGHIAREDIEMRSKKRRDALRDG